MNDLIELCIEFFIILFEPMIDFGFIVVVCCLIFRDRLRRSALRISVEMSFYLLALLLVLTYLVINGYDKVWIFAAGAFFLLGFLRYYTKTVSEGFQKLLFVFCVVFHFNSCLSLFSHILGISFGVPENFMLAAYIGILGLGGWAVYRWFTPRLRQIESRDMKWLWTAPAMFYFISEYLDFSFVYDGTRVIEPVDLAMSLLFLVSSFAVCLLLLRVLDGVAKNVRLESETTAINRQLALQREQYERIMKNAETVKFMRHDIRHHLTLMGELARGVEKLEDYIQSLSEKLGAAQEKYYCSNYAVNAVTAHYLGIAESEGVTVEARMEIPEDTGLVPDVDMCVIVGNFLENAVEACRRMKQGNVNVNKFIRVRSRVAGDSLSFVVTNSFDGLWRECGKEDVYLTRKTDKGEPEREGVGLSSVKAVCEKHRGLVQYEITRGVWKSSALVHMEQ